MTNIHDCLARGMDFGEIDRRRGTQAQAQYAQLFERYSTTMPSGQAAALAAADLKAATAKAKTQRYHKVVNQLQSMRRIRDLIETAPDPAAAIRNLLEHSEGSGFTGESVRSLTEAYESSINAGLRDVLAEVSTDVFSRSRNKPLLEDIIRELHGEATGNTAAVALAKSVRSQQQRMRRLYNAHGGDIGELSDFGISHTHDSAQLRLAGFDKWAAAIEGRLAWDRIPDLTTGKPFAAPGGKPNPASARRFLQDVYDGITTKGWDDKEPSMAMGGAALYNQRAEHRVLHFKSGSDWIEYNRQFGTSDPFSAMMGGLHGLARDVALMRVLGPNPNGGLEFAIQTATKRAETSGDAKLAERVQRSASLTKTMMAHQTGAANKAEHIGWARFLSGTRSTLSSIQLGSAVVSSVTDVATITAAAHAMGMNGRNVMGKSVELLASHATRDTAARMGYVAETLADTMAGMSRFQGQIFGTGLPEKLSSFTMRASGLSVVTDMRKIAFQMELSGHLADMAKGDFAAMDAPLRKALEARGITAADWDHLRDPATHFTAPSGANFITSHHWMNTQKAMPQVEAEGLAMRLQMFMQEQLEYAVPTASLQGRALLLGESKPGTWSGEFLRSSASYKAFTLSLTLGQYRRFMAIDGKWNRAMYAAKLSAMLLVTGAMAVQMKELVKGNDPRPMNTVKFWLAAQMQGGGLGIFGDFFSSAESRVGGGLGETLAGPVLGLASNVLQVGVGNLTAAAKGEQTHFGRDAADFLRKNTPFLSSAWYARTAYSRLVSDNVQAFLDPEAEIIFRRRLKATQRDYGTQSFIPMRGAPTELRLPNFANAIGGRP